MAIFTVPFDVSPAEAAGPLAAGALPLAPGEAAGGLLHAANTSIDAPASAVSLRNFIQSPPHS
jgi:hypothetical protein